MSNRPESTGWAGRLILEPIEEGSPIEEKDGLIVLGGRLLDADLDHRSDRDARLDKLSRIP